MFLWRFYRWFAITACAYRVYKSRHFHVTNNTHFPYKKNNNLRNPCVVNIKLVKSANYLAIYEKGARKRKDGGFLCCAVFSRFFCIAKEIRVDSLSAFHQHLLTTKAPRHIFRERKPGALIPRRRYVKLARITLMSDKYKAKHLGCVRRYQLATRTSLVIEKMISALFERWKKFGSIFRIKLRVKSDMIWIK